MKMHIVPVAACTVLYLSAPIAAQPAEPEADGEVNLEAVDMLFGDRAVTGGDAAEEGAVVVDEGEDAAEDSEEAAEEVVDEAMEEREPTDLERALAGYEICASEAGAGLAQQGFSPEQAGREALLRCGGQRAAYVNAFYFTLLPNYPDTPEAAVRASAERLAAQTDDAIAMLVAREIAEAPPAAETAAEEAPAEDEAIEADAPAEEEESE
ncbi:hypothetical protein [Parasphingopyxis marina]|uniref:DUF732 domain-containing protein n=1 Tax=Parasphingopyxis marina TaxID=2761622 RepID=A0A842HVB6_9SPHN|nr:hypothetical protein [Parasphingopyxis marina]MBC2776189.1 hypothetical protein [Parasphingopyxis marina]